MPHLFWCFGVFWSLWEAGTCLGWGSSGCSNGWNFPWGLFFFRRIKRFPKQRVWFLKRVVCWEWSSLLFSVKPSQVGGLVVMFRNFSWLIFGDRILKMPRCYSDIKLSQRLADMCFSSPTCCFWGCQRTLKFEKSRFATCLNSAVSHVSSLVDKLTKCIPWHLSLLFLS